MPTYEYKCQNGHTHTEVRPINSEQVTKTCAAVGCGTTLSRVFTAPLVSFKGSGFNKTTA